MNCMSTFNFVKLRQIESRFLRLLNRVMQYSLVYSVFFISINVDIDANLHYIFINS